jgi:CHASE3 domain sensor protein
MKIILTERQLRLISESPENQLNSVLASAGIQLTPEEMQEVNPDCPIEKPKQHEKLINQIESNLKKMSVKNLVGVLKQLLQFKKNRINEQAEAIIIAGVSVPPMILIAIVGVLIIIVIFMIARSIFGSERGFRDCRRKNRLFRRFGVQGVV